MGLGCEYVGPAEIFEPGDAEIEPLAMLFTTDADLMRDPERLEWLASVCALALPPGPEGLEAPDVLTRELTEDIQAWYETCRGSLLLPTTFTGGPQVEIAGAIFIRESSPEGYCDRAFWPALAFTNPDGERRVCYLPADIWWSPEVDPLTAFWGHLGDAYARRHELFGD